MAYQIRPIEFKNEAPDMDMMSIYVEEKSSQKICISEGEFKGQYSVALDKYPNDKLDLKREKQSIVISGDAGTAPALFEILYTCMISFGGKAEPNVKLLTLPISDQEVEGLNNRVRKELRKFGNYIWFFLFLSLFLICGSVYLIFSWLL